ncbi:S1 RNA-binding domain-containing protein [Lapidilactobacillus achengensis]|uniref:S1 RNA-binding domain-containing protein n=1 Tax=Lapidilactobacillus achengensis TaxID=2486000 RepID=A0ABW1ULT5_9LACO|nr:S1-like domain-containing RNA-binding protein [Lapidilactobacillus achengensis]
MLEQGTIVTATISDRNEQGFFAQAEGQTLRVDSPRTDFQTGTAVSGFVYQNMKGQWVLNTEPPLVSRSHVGPGEVVQVRRDLGVFINIGLPDKDVVLSLDELPELHNIWPQKGDHLYVSLKTDHKDRLWAEQAGDEYFKEHGRFSQEFTRNEAVSGTVYQDKKVGSFVVLTDKRLAFVHHTERLDEPRVGEPVQGRVIGLTRDGRLSISLRPLAYEEIADDAKMILAVLQRVPEQQMTYQDKSDPEEIKAYFGISKGAFKRALGSLLKLGLISTDREGTRLTDKGRDYRD